MARVTIRKCDFCGEFIPEDKPMMLVGQIMNGNWSNHADMCMDCFNRLAKVKPNNNNNDSESETEVE